MDLKFPKLKCATTLSKQAKSQSKTHQALVNLSENKMVDSWASAWPCLLVVDLMCIKFLELRSYTETENFKDPFYNL